MLHLMHLRIRKTAHVTEFGIFSITVFRGARAGRSGWEFNWAVRTLVIAVCYARSTNGISHSFCCGTRHLAMQ